MTNRKIIILLPFLCSSVVLTSCLFNKKEKATYTVTFRQTGFDDIVKTVKEGESLADIPVPNSKTGYTVTWNKTDFNNISHDLTVYAISTANEYTVTYKAPGFSIDGGTTKVTYDAKCSSLDMSLTKEGASFLGWEYNSVVYTSESIWNVADNVTLTAKFEQASNFVTITFIDTNGDFITKAVEKGGNLTDIPAPTAKTGYNVYWDVNDFNNLTENITVNALKVAKTYTVNLNPNGGEVSETTLTVTFDEAYSLPAPTNDDYFFDTWKLNDLIVPTNGTWNIDDESGVIELVAQWGESKWTEIL